jgi:ABC-type transport system substrate-binding protein
MPTGRAWSVERSRTVRIRQRLMTLGACVLLAAGCQSAASPSPSTSGSQGPASAVPSPSDQPVDGGTLTYAMPSDIVTLDTVYAGGGTTSVSVRNMIYEKLVAFRPNVDNVEIVPQLATDWTVDGKQWTFNLRTGVTFHDGTPFNAAAVKAHFDRILGPEEPTSVRDWGDFLESVEVVDDDTVVFTTKFEDPAHLERLAGISGAIESPAAVEEFGTDIATNPVGTGPFKFVEWVAEQRIVLERNDDYWGSRPHLDGVVIRPIPEAGARVIAVQSGDIDLAAVIQPEQIPQVEGDAALAFESWPTVRQLFLGMHNLKPPFDNKEVRQALNHAIDWDSIISSIFQGHAERISVIPMGLPGAVNESPFAYDPDEAKRLLSEAGFPNGFETTLVTPQGAYLKDFELAQVVQQQLGEVGVTADLQVVEFARYIELVRQPTLESELVMWIDSWSADTTASILRSRYHCDMFRPAGVNIDGYCNDEVDPLIEQAEQSLDEATRLEALSEAQAIITEDAPSIWGITLFENWAVSTRVNGALHSTGGEIWANENTWLAGS